jgi:hypothetical protein
MKGDMIPIQAVEYFQERKIGTGNSLEQEMFLLIAICLGTDKG